MDGGSSMDDQRRRLQMEVQLLEQSLSNSDQHKLRSLSDESDSSDSTEDQDTNQDQSGLEARLLEQRNLLHRQIQELERTLRESSSSTEDNTDDDDKDEKDSSSSNESDMELPRSVESCLQMNLVYQQVIEETLVQLEILLQQNTRQQKELMIQLSGPGSDRDQPRPGSSNKTTTNVYLGSFLKPYFKDRLTGLGPPSNAETREKRAQMLGNLDDRKLKIRRWEGWQKVLLIHAVSRDRLRKLIQPKISKVDFLTQKLSSASDFDKVQIQEQIQTLEREIQTLREKKEEDLIEDRFEDVDWARISNIDFEGSREPTDLQCFWQNFLHPSINKERWNNNEIHKLKELSLKNQERNWTQISLELGTRRAAFMCLQTYQRFVSNSLRKRRWTPADDAQLRHLVEKMRIGNFIPYTQMCYFMEDRLPAQLLYRWNQVLDPRLRKGPWSPQEDQLLLAAVEKHGAKNWWKIRFEVPGRTDTGCRDRYLDCLRPGTKKGPFDQKERLLLRTLLLKHGVGCWSKIAAEIPNRTDAQCMRESRRLLKSRGSQDTVEKAEEETQKDAVLQMKKTAQKTKSWEKSGRTEGLDAQKPPVPALALKRSLRKRWRPKWRDVVFDSGDEAEEEVPYMDMSDEEKLNTEKLSDSGEELDTIDLKREDKKPTAVKLEETPAPTGEQQETGAERTNGESKMKLDTSSLTRDLNTPRGAIAARIKRTGIAETTGGATATWVRQTEITTAAGGVTTAWVRRRDFTDLVSEDTSRRSFSFRPAALTPTGGGQCERRDRCTIVDRAGCSVVVAGRPVELPWERRHHSTVLMMIHSRDLSALLHLQVLKSSHRSGQKRQTETSLNYQLQAAMVPWIGHVVLWRDSCVPMEHKNRDANVSEPMEQHQKSDATVSAPTIQEQQQKKPSVSTLRRDETQISSTKLFRFFLHALRVDAEGCKHTIEVRQLRQQQGAETKVISRVSRTAAAILGEQRIKQEPKSPDRMVQTPPALLALLPRPQMFAPFLPQLQNVCLLPPVGQNGGTCSPASPQNRKVLEPLPQASAPALFTVIAPLWTSHSHQLLPYSMVNKVRASAPDNVQPPSSASTKANPPQTVSQGTADALSSQKQNVREVYEISSTSSLAENARSVHVLSSPSTHPLLPTPPQKQNVHLFRDTLESQKVHVIKVYPKTEKLDLEKNTGGSQSEGDVKTQSSFDSEALLDHCYTPLFNQRALSVPSSNQNALSVSSSNHSARSVASPNQMTPKKRGRAGSTKKTGVEEVSTEEPGAEAVITEEPGAEEESGEGKRRRKLTMKAQALHQDQVKQKKQKESRSEKKQRTKRHKRTPSIPTSLGPSSSLPTSSAPTSSLHTSSLPCLIVKPLSSDPSLKSGLPSASSLASFPSIPSFSSLCPSSLCPSLLTSNAHRPLSAPLLPSLALLGPTEAPLPVSTTSSLTCNASLCPNQTSVLPSFIHSSSAFLRPFSESLTPSLAPLDLTEAPIPVSATSSSPDQTLLPFSASLTPSHASLDRTKAHLPVSATSSSPDQALLPFIASLTHSGAPLGPTKAPLPVFAASSSPTQTVLPSSARLPPSSASLTSSLTPLGPTYAPLPICSASSTPNQSLLATNASLVAPSPASRVPLCSLWLSPKPSLFPDPPIKSHPPPPSDVKLSELHDWLSGGRDSQAAVSRWLSGKGGVSEAIANTKNLPYLPPFTSNLKTLSLLLQRKDELRREAARLLRKPTGRGGVKTQIGIFQTVEAGEHRAEGMSFKTPTQADRKAKQAKSRRIKGNTAEETKPTLGSKIEVGELPVAAGDVKSKICQTANTGESRGEESTLSTHTRVESKTVKQAKSLRIDQNVAEEAKPGLDSEMEEGQTKTQEKTQRGTANEKTPSQTGAERQGKQGTATTHELTSHTTEASQQSAKQSQESRNKQTNDTPRTTDEPPIENPETKREQANQRPVSGSEPPANQEPAKAELKEAVRQIVRERFSSNPAHQLLLARFLSIFTLPAFLASLQPITGQDEEEGGTEPTTDQPITEADDASDTDRRRSHDSGTRRKVR